MFHRELTKAILILNNDLSSPNSPEEDLEDALSSLRGQLPLKLPIPLFPIYVE